MRIYKNPMEMVREVERDLFEMGIRYQTETVQDKKVGDDDGYQTIELSPYAYTLTTPTHWAQLDEMMDYLKVDKDWAHAEASERLVGPEDSGLPRNPGQAWKLNANLWEPFLRDGMFSYTYSERWGWQLPYVIEELHRRPNTRQAVMTMYSAERDIMNFGGRDRVPCSLTYHFMIRDGELNLIYNQRSCDFMTFFAADVYFTAELLNYVAVATDTTPGKLTHFIGSLHAFKKDLADRNIF